MPLPASRRAFCAHPYRSAPDLTDPGGARHWKSMPLPLCHILRARLRQQGKGDKSTLPVPDNSTLRLQQAGRERVLWHGEGV